MCSTAYETEWGRYLKQTQDWLKAGGYYADPKSTKGFWYTQVRFTCCTCDLRGVFFSSHLFLNCLLIVIRMNLKIGMITLSPLICVNNRKQQPLNSRLCCHVKPTPTSTIVEIPSRVVMTSGWHTLIDSPPLARGNDKSTMEKPRGSIFWTAMPRVPTESVLRLYFRSRVPQEGVIATTPSPLMKACTTEPFRGSCGACVFLALDTIWIISCGIPRGVTTPMDGSPRGHVCQLL